MERYSIYCTEEQTKKALELGAPIKLFWDDIIENFEDCEFCMIPPQEDELGIMCDYAVIPTAEQMLGWLEEQGITIESVRCDMFWFARSYSDENTNFNKGRFSSRKESTLAAIDAALDYLIANKK